MKRKSLRYSLLKVYNLLYKKFGSRNWWPASSKFEIIIGAILTQNTAWSNVEKAIKNLKKHSLLKVAALSQISKTKLTSLIRPTGYYNIKAERLKEFLKFLTSNYNGNIYRMFKEDTHPLREKLLNIKGIGPETADSILLYAGNKPIFVIDAYTKRIFSRHNFIKGDEPYEKIQRLFLKELPRDVQLYNEYHALIVELGKSICRKSNPLCNECPIKGINQKGNEDARRNKGNKKYREAN